MVRDGSRGSPLRFVPHPPTSERQSSSVAPCFRPESAPRLRKTAGALGFTGLILDPDSPLLISRIHASRQEPLLHVGDSIHRSAPGEGIGGAFPDVCPPCESGHRPPVFVAHLWTR